MDRNGWFDSHILLIRKCCRPVGSTVPAPGDFRVILIFGGEWITKISIHQPVQPVNACKNLIRIYKTWILCGPTGYFMLFPKVNTTNL